MGFLLSLVFLAFTIIRVDYQETNDVTFYSYPSILPDVSVPVLTFGRLNEKLLDSAGFLSCKHLVQVAVFLFLAALLWNQRQEEGNIHQVRNNTKKFTTTKVTTLGEMRSVFTDDQQQLLKGTHDLSVWDKKTECIKLQLEGENKNLEKMFDCFNEFKHDWKEQAGKLNQIELTKIVDVPSVNIHTLIEEQKCEIEGYYHHAEGQFTQINKNLADDHRFIISISAGIDSMHDVLNEESASQF